MTEHRRMIHPLETLPEPRDNVEEVRSCILETPIVYSVAWSFDHWAYGFQNSRSPAAGRVRDCLNDRKEGNDMRHPSSLQSE